jgi:hypothetical protein
MSVGLMAARRAARGIRDPGRRRAVLEHLPGRP